MPEQTSKQLIVSDLVIELTRRCNMRCEHCLRGDAENIDMPISLLSKIFEPIKEVEVLTFTGGEPSMVPWRIKAALNAAKNTRVRQVYLVTNGKFISEDFLQYLREWHVKCIQDRIMNEYGPDGADIQSILDLNRDPELRTGVHVAVSADPFHENVPESEILKLCTLPNLVVDKCRDSRTDDWVLRTGRALWNGLEGQQPEHTRRWAYGPQTKELELERTNGMIFCPGILYVNVHGRLFKYCDYSYADQDEIDDYVLGQIDPDNPDPNWVGRLCRDHMDKEA